MFEVKYKHRQSKFFVVRYLRPKLLKTVHFVPVQEVLALASQPGLTVKRVTALQQNQRPLLKLEDRRRRRMQEVLKVMRSWR